MDHKEVWCCKTVMMEKTLESHLDSKEIKPVNNKGNLPWIFIGRTVAEAEAPILWVPYAKNQLILMSLLDPDAWKVWGQEEKRVTEDEMVHSIFELADMSLSKFQETVKDRKASHDAVHGVTKSQTCLMTEQENFKAHERHLKERGKRKTLYSSIPFNLWRKVYK